MLLAGKSQDHLDRSNSAQDLYSVLTPITWSCQVFGVFPLWLKGPVGKRKYSSSQVFLIYDVTALVLSMTGLIMWMKRINETVLQDNWNRTIIRTSIHLDFELQSWTMIVMIVMAIKTRNQFANAVDTMSSQDEMLRKLGTRFNYAADLNRTYMRLGLNVSVIIVLFTYHFIHQFDFYVSRPLIWVAWMYPNAVRILSICVSGEVLSALRQRFTVLNEHLGQMIEETKCLRPETISTRINHSERLGSIAEIHGALYEVASDVNKTFGLNIIIGVICAIKILPASTYHITHEITDPIDISWMKIFGYLNWGFISFSHIVYLVAVCNSTQHQASITEKLVHKFYIDNCATAFNTMIRSFSLQLYHEKIEFSAACVFSLDATLLQSVLATVTTYLVILIQF